MKKKTTKKRHYHFVDGKQVNRQEFEKAWRKEGFKSARFKIPPPKGFGSWQGKKRYSIRWKK